MTRRQIQMKLVSSLRMSPISWVSKSKHCHIVQNHSSNKNISHSNTYIKSYIQISNILMTILYSLY